MKNRVIVAIDGPAASGKSTVAKLIADRLGLNYLDTGAMYRAYTLYVINNSIDPDDEEEINNNLANISIEFDKRDIFLNKINVSKEIRNKEVTLLVSKVCAYKKVREFMVDEQRRLSLLSSNGVILDGRDIGTVVFPNADVKIFLTANYDVRGLRRLKDNERLGINMSLEEIKEDLKRRDYLDSNRANSPLKVAEDATILDNSNMTLEETCESIISMIKEKINA